MEEKVHTGLTYGVEDKPDLGTTIVLGFQNVITAFGGLVAVPLIIAGIAGFGYRFHHPIKRFWSEMVPRRSGLTDNHGN